MAAATPGLSGQTFQGLSAGINQALPVHEIPDSAAVWLQDILLDVPGVIRQRGPLSNVGPTISNTPWGVASELFADGTLRSLFLSGTTTPKLNYFQSNFSSATTSDTLTANVWGSTGPVWDAKPALNVGTFIGASAAYSGDDVNLVLWRGARSAQYTTGTITATQGNATITGSGTAWLTHAEKGMFLFANGDTYLGVVLLVNSDTSISLETGALNAATAGSTYTLSSFRSPYQRNVKGRITCDTASATVTGADTKFKTMAGSTWNLYRQSDMTFIGAVSGTPTSDTSLTLAANAAISMSNDAFVGIRDTGSKASGDGNWFWGFLNTTYQGRQFYANSNLQSNGQQWSGRVWFSDTSDPEGMDTSSDDGDFFDITSQSGTNKPITALAGLQNALAIFKEKELFALTGNDPTNFVLRKIADVGAVSSMSVVTWKNAVIFASREGVFAFDGVSLTELSVELGQYWKDAVQAYNIDTDRAYAFIYRNHYVIHLTKFASSYGTTRNSITTDITAATWMLNLDTGAWTFHTNLGIRGAIPFTQPYAIVANASSGGNVIDVATLWTGTGLDGVTCSGQTAGPSFYIETKRYPLGDPELKKNFKQMSMQYIAIGDTLTMDTVPGLTDTGAPISKAWPQQLTYTNVRRKFQKRSTHLGLRLYPTTGTLREGKIGPWQLLFKPLRLGRT